MLFPYCYYHQKERREIRKSGLFEAVFLSGKQSLKYAVKPIQKET